MFTVPSVFAASKQQRIWVFDFDQTLTLKREVPVRACK